jgi:long-chain fatty acid transport protein
MATRLWPFGTILFVLGVTVAGQVSAQGILITGAGPINRSMAGAAVAAPIDAAGSMFWNPAAISGLDSSQILFGAEFPYTRNKVSSRLPAGSLGGGLPPVTMSGQNISQSGVSVLPTFAMVHRSDDSPWSWGLGLFSLGGVGANYPANLQNPVLTPPPPNGFGTGPVFSHLSLAQFVPTVSAEITDGVSIGLAPTIAVASFGVTPGVFASPDDANGNGVPTYPSATNDRLRWGLGFQVGIYVEMDNCWSFGASYKSPQWLEDFQFNSADELGVPRLLTVDADFPAIVSLGAAYWGIPRTVVALDLHYVDYANADTLGDPAGFDASGALTGFGWESAFSASLGVQYELNDCNSVRVGYLFTENPIPSAATSINVPATAIYKHALFIGSSLKMTDALTFSWAYLHSIPSGMDGPILTPLGPVPGSSVHVGQAVDSLMAGVHVDF